MHKKNQSSKIKALKTFPGSLLQNFMTYFLRWWTSVANPWFSKTININMHLNFHDLSVSGRQRWDNSLKLWATYSASSIVVSKNKETASNNAEAGSKTQGCLRTSLSHHTCRSTHTLMPHILHADINNTHTKQRIK